MTLPVTPPVSPMLAKLARELPVAEDMFYEPKWDGFRCIVFHDGDQVELGSRNEKPLTRYFPELIEPMRANSRIRASWTVRSSSPLRTVSTSTHSCNVSIRRRRGCECSLRPHPHRSWHSTRWSLPTATFAAEAFEERRQLLEDAMAGAEAPLFLTPRTTSTDVALDWFSRFEGAGLDGGWPSAPAIRIARVSA